MNGKCLEGVEYLVPYIGDFKNCNLHDFASAQKLMAKYILENAKKNYAMVNVECTQLRVVC